MRMKYAIVFVSDMGPCTQVPTPLFGALLAQYLDPDGLPISVSEERSAR